MISFATTNLHDDEANNYVLLPPTKDKEDLYNCISTMLKQEECYLCHDYLKGNNNTKGAIACRSKVCQWIFQTVDCLKLQSETAIVAISHLDRFLCSNSSPRAKRARCDRREYRLVAMTSLYIAIKITESIEMHASTISRLLIGLQSAEDIISCERDILTSLRWKVQGPTPFQFSSYILELFPDGSTRSAVARKLYGDSLQQIELAIRDYACVILRRSSIAIASILNSLESVPQDDFSSDERTHFFQKIHIVFDVDVTSPLITAVRWRLLDRSAKLSRV